MIHPLQTRFELAFPPEEWLGRRVILAVSGGPDSIALLRLTAAASPPKLRESLLVVHVHHHLRGEDSAADAQFTQAVAVQQGISCRVFDCPLEPEDRIHGSLEQAAREKRYAALLQAAETWGARYVLTGHTADDQAETVLFRLVRGCGIRGLAGIPKARPFGPAALTRPLLTFFRYEILDYLKYLNQPYRVDHTNRDARFRRNALRHKVLPLLRRHVSQSVVSQLNHLADLARECDDFLRSQVEAAWPRVVAQTTGNSIGFRVTELRRLHPYLVKEVFRKAWQEQGWPLREMAYPHWNRLSLMVASTTSGPGTAPFSPVLPGRIRARLDEEHLILERLPARDAIVAEQADAVIDKGVGSPP